MWGTIPRVGNVAQPLLRKASGEPISTRVQNKGWGGQSTYKDQHLPRQNLDGRDEMRWSLTAFENSQVVGKPNSFPKSLSWRTVLI